MPGDSRPASSRPKTAFSFRPPSTRNPHLHALARSPVRLRVKDRWQMSRGSIRRLAVDPAQTRRDRFHHRIPRVRPAKPRRAPNTSIDQNGPHSPTAEGQEAAVED